MTIVRNELKKAAAKQQTQQRQLQSEISLSGIQVDLTGIRLKSWFFFCFFSLVQEQVWPQRYRYKGTQIQKPTQRHSFWCPCELGVTHSNLAVENTLINQERYMDWEFTILSY